MVRIASILLSLVSADEVKLATFDGLKETSLKWRKTVDPVMGGSSTGEFKITDAGTGKFTGTCNTVSKLAAPGFVNVQGSGRTLADVTGADSLLLKVKSSTPNYQGFKVAFGAPGIPRTSIFVAGNYKTEFYLADTTDWQTVQVPLTNFSRDTSDFTGRCDTKDPSSGSKQHYCCSASPLTPSKDEVCVESKYLSAINRLAVWAEGVEGDFDLEIEWIGANPSTMKAEASDVSLVTFDGAKEATTRTWKQQNDPVMGGKSSGTFSITDGVGVMDGTVAIVPSLSAPGFIQAFTTDKKSLPRRLFLHRVDYDSQIIVFSGEIFWLQNFLR